MKDFKVQLDDRLWERFYRLFPGHGERTTLIRKIIRRIVVMQEERPTLDKSVAERVCKDLGEKDAWNG